MLRVGPGQELGRGELGAGEPLLQALRVRGLPALQHLGHGHGPAQIRRIGALQQGHLLRRWRLESRWRQQTRIVQRRRQRRRALCRRQTVREQLQPLDEPEPQRYGIGHRVELPGQPPIEGIQHRVVVGCHVAP